MKILTWNCNGAFRNKFTALEEFDADIIIIQECENPEISNNDKYREFSRNSIWIGNNKNKGLGIFAKDSIKIEKLNWSNTYQDHEVNYFLPILINDSIKLIGVWAHKNNSPTFGYIGQVWKYLESNKNKIESTFLIGDFNSNSKWDCWDRWWNHSDVVETLKINEIESVYHFVNKLEHGNEIHNTFFLQRNFIKGYHIDYCFIPSRYLEKIKKFIIEDFSNWKNISDHIPMFFEIDLD